MKHPTRLPPLRSVTITLDLDVVEFIAENVGLTGPEHDGWAYDVGEACRKRLDQLADSGYPW